MNNPEVIQREKTLFAYSLALERGDFARVEMILGQAASDPILERQIMEIHAALSQVSAKTAASPAGQNLTEKRWQWIKISWANLASSSFWRGPLPRVAGLVLVIGLVLTIGTLALLGPAVGKVFSNVVMNVPSRANGYPAVAATAMPAIKAPEATRTVAQSGDRYLAPYNAYPAPEIQQQTDRLIVRTSTLSLVAKDTRLARQAVTEMIAGFSGEGAYVVSATESYTVSGSPLPVITMTLRVPVNRYSESMDRLVGLGIQVLRRQENAQDVTQSYVDVTARIEALQTSRARLLTIIKEAKNTDDLLRAEQELSRREAELEAAKANQQYLAQTAALSSITLELRPAETSQPVTDNSWDPAATFHNAVRTLLATLTDLANGSIIFAVTTLPWLVVLGLLMVGAYRLIWGKRK